MRPKALIFGSIGTIADTSEMERRAFNRAFVEAGLDWKWDAALYAELGCHRGSRDRIAEFAEDRGLVVDAAALAGRKTEIFFEDLAEHGAQLRQGVLQVISAATAAAIPVALASTRDERLIRTVLEAAGMLCGGRIFAFLGHRGLVNDVKPAPDIYLRALRELGVAARDVIAIESSAVSARAAQAAGVPIVAFPSAYAGGTFEGAHTLTRRLTPASVGLGCELRGFKLAS